MILREFPPNPTLVIYYTRRQLTTRMSERYGTDEPEYPKDIVTRLSRIEGIGAIEILRHRLRLKKLPQFQWDTILPRVEQILRDEWKEEEVQAVERSDLRRTFQLPAGVYYDRRHVFEGVDHSRQNPLAARLYQVKGITTVVLYRDQAIIKRSCCFPWEELKPKITRILALIENSL